MCQVRHTLLVAACACASARVCGRARERRGREAGRGFWETVPGCQREGDVRALGAVTLVVGHITGLSIKSALEVDFGFKTQDGDRRGGPVLL